MNRGLLLFSVLVCFFLLCVPVALSQSQPICDTLCGPDPNGSGYGGVVAARSQLLNARGMSSATTPVLKKPVDPTWGSMSVVVGSQSYNYTIPILHLPGRNGKDLVLNLYYNARVWTVDNTGHSITFNADRDFPSYGFRLDFGYIEKQGIAGWVLTEADGTKRFLDNGGINSSPADSTDGSAIEFSPSTHILSYANGTTVQYLPFESQANSAAPTLYRPVWIKDTNGNYFSIAYVTGHDQRLQGVSDTLGRVINFEYNSDGTLEDIFQTVAVSTNDPTGKHIYASFSWATPYASGYHWYNFTGLTVNGGPSFTPSAPIEFLAGCTYANGTGYRFTYGDWGIIEKIESLSHDGITRNYVAYNFPSAAGSVSDAPTFTTETISPDGTSNNTSVWTYSAVKPSTGVVTSMSVTDPLGNSETTTLGSTGLITTQQFYDSGSNLLRTLNYSWTSAASGVTAATVIGSVTTTLNDTGQQSKIQYGYDPAYGIRTDVYEYDYGLSLKRHTVTSYLQTAPYTTRHILNFPSQILVKDGQGNTLARTDFAYDSTSLTSVTNASNHDDTAYGSTFTARANLTSVTRYSNAAAGSGPVTRQLFYNSVGNLLTAQTDCCTQQDSTFTNTTHYGYPESVAVGPPGGTRLTTSSTYNFDFGLVTSTTDANNQTSSFQYDSMLRLTKSFLPPQGSTSVEYDTAYGDDGQFPTVTSSSSNAGNTPKTVTTTDGLGHVTRSDVYDGATLKSSATSSYDKLWRRTQASTPFAPGETPFYTTFTYDGLGRASQVTPPSGGFTQFSYSGNTVLLTDPAGKQRKNFSDALGRLIEVDEPGYGDALPGSGSVTIGGSEGSLCTIFFNNTCRHTIYDIGSVSITVNSATKSLNYGQNSTSSNLAIALANLINGDSTYPVSAGVTGSTIFLTAKTGGNATNYSLSATSSTSDPNDFGTASFTATPSASSLTGGDNSISSDSPSINRPIRTTYTYDVVGHLLSASVGAMGPVGGVTYSGQLRSWSYDSVGRQTSSSAPELGTVNFFYTKNDGVSACSGNPMAVCYSTDARGVTTTLSYSDPGTGATDPLNRLRGISYSGGASTPSVGYTYDTGTNAVGRLSQITDGANSRTFTYDNLGRTTKVDNLMDGAHYTVGYSFNLSSEITSITYPTGRVVAYTPDTLGRVTSISDAGTQYLTINPTSGYNGAGQITSLTLGNQVQGQFQFNDHLQLSSIRYFKGANEILNLGYDYGSMNNGQIQAVHYYTANGPPKVEDQTKSEMFTYDAWSRLKQAQTGTVDAGTPGTWRLQWSYDQLGNLLQQQLTGGNLPNGIGQPNFSIDLTTNRIASPPGYAYDNAGNMIQDPAGSYAFDSASRLVNVNAGAATYAYFGSQRIKKVNGSTTTRYIYSGGKPIVEYVGSQVSREYIYAGGQLLATISGSTVTYYHPDHLSNRAETDSSGNVVRTFGQFPYGEVWYETPSATDKWKFTTYERDLLSGDTGLDYANARYYGTRTYRFMGVDLLSGSLATPQSLNRYAYVSNDPINLVDPTGMMTGNFRCLLNQFGDCVGGDYSGAGFSWMDPMGMWGGTPNGQGGCSVDGQSVDCGMAAALLQMDDAAMVCPNNDCGLRYDPTKGWVNPFRTGSDGTWQVYEPGFYYYDSSEASGDNTDGYGYRNGRWVPAPRWVTGMDWLFMRPYSGNFWIPISPGVGISPALTIDGPHGKVCASLGVGFGSRVPGANFGPLMGDIEHAPELLSGVGITIQGQSVPGGSYPTGGQAIWGQPSKAPQLYGPTFGTPGVSFTVNLLGGCTRLP